jgi:poly-gamma-glutamate synthesis protein (capsule biosynthesis protein)
MSLSDSVTLIVGGDLCPVGRIGRELERGDAVSVFGSLLAELRAADLFVANLECPLVEAATPAIKGGPVLEASPRCLAGLKQVNLRLVGLANNHILDHGAHGLATTIASCRAAGIGTVGAGANLSEAGQLWIERMGGLRVGVMAMAEAEYSLAGRRSPGANPLDPIRTARVLRQARADCDFLIALVHGGNEHLAIPRPGLRDYCRWLVEEGVRVAVCQHSHCVGTYEEHGGGLIIYGQGNFLFDYPSRRTGWGQGILVKLEVEGTGEFSYELIPVTLEDSGRAIRRLPEGEAVIFLKDFRTRSLVLSDDDAYEEEWQRFCDGRKWIYLSMLHGFSRPLYLLNWTGLLTRLLYTKSQIRNIFNLIRCESHREVLTTLSDTHLEAAREKPVPQSQTERTAELGGQAIV